MMDYYILSGIFQGMNPDDIREWLKENDTCQDAVDAFAAACNQAFLTAHEADDYQPGSKNRLWAEWVNDAWFSLYYELLERILLLARAEGFTVPDRGYHEPLVPFMEKYGYRDGAGWWIQTE